MLSQIPKLIGIYIMFNNVGDIIYIGKSKNLKNRISSYFNNANINSKTAAIVTSIQKISYISCISEREALLLERQLIKKIKPHFNFAWKDDKSYPYIKLSVNEDFPRLILTRKKEKDFALYFGPYPQFFYVKKLVRWLNRVFKIRQCKINLSERNFSKKSNKPCFYYHSDMCYGVCFGKITPEEYRQKIYDVKLFLSGKFKNLENKLKKQMFDLSLNTMYENAKEIRDRIYALRSMSERIMINEINYEEINKYTNLTSGASELKKIIGLKCYPAIIDGIDCSNICGVDPVGSSVRFQNGIADKKKYRKFKIKTVCGINDFASIREIVFRRYSLLLRKKEIFPDLILIDGGEVQLKYALDALNDLGLNIPVISIAKKNDEIFLQNKNKPLILDKHSSALKLLQSIRNEAHRFAINYHRKLRVKNIFDPF
jgi:excinuclease ABC subunit C